MSDAPRSSNQIRINILMDSVFNGAIRRCSLTGTPFPELLRELGVRQCRERERIPTILEVEEIQALLDELPIRKHDLVFLAIAVGPSNSPPGLREGHGVFKSGPPFRVLGSAYCCGSSMRLFDLDSLKLPDWL